MARAFLDEDCDVRLLYASIESLRVKPKIDENDLLYDDHCVVEVTLKNGKIFIIDTSLGFIFDKSFYYLMEHPKIRKINSKEDIIKFVELEESYHSQDIENDKYFSLAILPLIEMTYGKSNEMYSALSIGLLQREIEHFKKVIDYEGLREEINEEMEKMILKK